MKKGGSQWRWCLVGNIEEAHKYGEEHEIKIVTKQFMPGAKIYLAPSQGGLGCESVVVIGKPQHRCGMIEIIMRREYITNYRLQKVLQPAVLERMEKSNYSWWVTQIQTGKRLLRFLTCSSPPPTKKYIRIKKLPGVEELALALTNW